MDTVLIIDDEEKLRTLLSRIIALEGYRVLQAGTLRAGNKVLEKESVQVILCDVKLPDGDGVEATKEFVVRFPYAEVILLTAFGNIADGVQAVKNGAFDYLTKGDDNDRILPLLSRAIDKANLRRQVADLESQFNKKPGFETIIGASPAIQKAVELARKVAATDATVLLLGETGTGKEVFASAIHSAGTRSAKPFLALNCSALSKELLESELFGYKAGAFTGANTNKKGLIEEANQGTLFLDEIGDMPLELQAKLLRVLENHTFIKVGDTAAMEVDVRIIAATNRNLEDDVKEGRFREDLFYRLNIFTINLPPLRERKKDIALLAAFYLQIFAAKTAHRTLTMSASFMEQLQQHHWKGNIRELKNVMQRAVILAETDELTPQQLPYDIQHPDTEKGNAYQLSVVENKHIRKVLEHTNGNKPEAAHLLGIGLATLYRKIEEYKI